MEIFIKNKWTFFTAITYTFLQLSSEMFNRYNQGLTSIPTDIPNTTTHLHLKKNEITSIGSSDLSHLTELEELALSNNPISSFADDALSRNEKLKYLFLNKSYLTTPPNLWQAKNSLRALRIDDAKLDSTPEDYFTNMTEMRTIHLNGNKLTQVRLGQMDKLSYINLRDNKLTAMPELTTPIPGLTNLYLHHNSIVNLDNNYFSKTPHLRILNLEHNKILVSPVNICPLSGLKELKLRNNKLTEFPNVTCSSETLEYIDLFSNNINHPVVYYEDFTSGRNSAQEKITFPNVHFLRLGLNNIDEFSADFFEGFPNLKKLECQKCRLKVFPNVSNMNR